MRRMISFKIENLPEKQYKAVDEWANHQVNLTQSLANVIMHVIKGTGYTDVMDFDTQAKLHNVFSGAVPVIQEDQQKNEPLKPPQKASTVDELPSAIDIFEEQ